MPGKVSTPLFIADWLDVIFVHFRVDAGRLAGIVPLPLDLHRGEAFVSLVAFTQSRLRPARGGRVGELLLAPLARHEFLNVRTYVRRGDVRGIFFLAEWIPNRLATLIGPRMYGLPYRLGRLRYEKLSRRVEARGGRLSFAISPPGEPAPAAAGTLDHFLAERYTAFTSRGGVTRRFDVDHAPWPIARVAPVLTDSSLLSLTGDWWQDGAGAQIVAAHYSPGVLDVTMSPPLRLASATSDQYTAACMMLEPGRMRTS
ncbi:MAG: DUF2071 domain-containing protein [Tepidisphaeraceae bacterium]